MILLDTHALIWADFGSQELGPRALEAIEQAGASGTLAVSAISFWEAAMLASKARIALPAAPLQWRRMLLETGLIELPLTGEVGIQAAELAQLHQDPVDRIICATALQAGATLVTADTGILAWKGGLKTLDARL